MRRYREFQFAETEDYSAWQRGARILRQDAYRDEIATVFADLGVIDRTERVRLYRFARAVLRLGFDDVAEPRDRRGRTRALLDLEAAIRDAERGVAAPAEPQLALTLPSPATPTAANPWPGPARVLATLMTRNIRVMLARDPLAYLWLFLAPALTIAVHFWAYTFLLGFSSVLDMPTLPFLILGIGGWQMMRVMTLKLGQELTRERNLTRLEPIDTLTIALAKALELSFSYTAVVAVALAVAAFASGDPAPRNLLGVAFYWVLLAVSGFGLGLLLNCFRHYLPAVSLLAVPVFLVGFFFSGVVVVSEQFPERFRAVLMWNPLLHIEQLLRGEYFVQYQSVDAMPSVACFFVLTVLFLGCAAEASRRRLVTA